MGKAKVIFTVEQALAPELRKIIYEYLYTKGDNNGIVFKEIANNPDLTAEQIRYKIEKTHKIYRSREGVIKMAKECKLQIKE